jgi:glycosyltransferase involved in cell wall biosynthesis
MVKPLSKFCRDSWQESGNVFFGSIQQDLPRRSKNPMKRIWYIHPAAGGPGLGRYDRPFHLSKHWQKQGLLPTVISPSYHHLMDEPMQSGPCRIQGVSYHFLSTPYYSDNSWGRLRNTLTFAVRLAVAGENLVSRYGMPHAIIFSSPTPYGFLSAYRLAKRYTAVCIFEVRDLWPASLIELCDMSPSHPMVILTRWVERFAYKKANKVVSLLPGTLGYMKEAGLEPQKWHYIPNGIEHHEIEEVCPEHQCFSVVRKWRDDGFNVVVYAGALGRPNNIEPLIHALKEAKQTGVKIKAIIVGRGELYDRLRGVISDLGLVDDVAMFGQIPKIAVKHLFEVCDAGYISLRPAPLLRFGVSPNKLFDYMAAKLPVISAVATEHDIVARANCGISVNPSNVDDIAGALIEFCSLSRHKRNELGVNGRQYVLSQHSYSTLSKLYQNVLLCQ